jgi:hypothetical protein
MERTDLKVAEGANRLRAGRLSRHRPDGESRRLPDDRMLWKWTNLMRFAHFPTINSVFSNAAELRLWSRNVDGFPMQNRPPMARRDLASEAPNSNENCVPHQSGTPRTPTARGPAVAEIKDGSRTEFNDEAVGRLSSPAMERTALMLGKGANRDRAGRLSRHRQVGESRREPDDRMLWKGNALMRFVHFPTINSIISNSVELRLQSRHVVGVPMEKRYTMTERDVVS